MRPRSMSLIGPCNLRSSCSGPRRDAVCKRGRARCRGAENRASVRKNRRSRLPGRWRSSAARRRAIRAVPHGCRLGQRARSGGRSDARCLELPCAIGTTTNLDCDIAQQEALRLKPRRRAQHGAFPGGRARLHTCRWCRASSSAAREGNASLTPAEISILDRRRRIATDDAGHQCCCARHATTRSVVPSSVISENARTLTPRDMMNPSRGGFATDRSRATTAGNAFTFPSSVRRVKTPQSSCICS